MMNDLKPMDEVDVIIQDALEKDDPSLVFHQIRNLEEKKELIEAAKSKFFYTLNEVWDKFTISKLESLHTQAYDGLGLHPHTVDRYITLWEYQGVLPETIQERPVREQFVVTKMLSQGFEPSEEQWEDLERTNTKSEVDAVVRDIKKQKPKKGSLQGYVDEEGTLYGWMNGRRADAGYLDIRSDDPIIQKLVKRIIDSAGVLRK